MKNHIHSFLLSGGVGSRLWPLSRKDAPKQFHQLGSENTLFEDSIRRLQSIKGGSVYVIASAGHAPQVEMLSGQFSLPAANCILEPVGRNTAAAIAIAANIVLERNGDGLMLIAPSDHKISDNDDFANCIAAGISAANDGAIVVFGVPPKRAETGFGYIEVETGLTGPVFDVASFREKPDLATAQEFLKRGDFYWNAGIFLLRASVAKQHFSEFCPDIWRDARQALNNADQKNALFLAASDYEDIRSESFDVAIMQRANPIKMVKADFGWSDLGSWEAIYEMGKPDEKGNVLRGDIVASDCQNSLLWSDGPLVAAYGLNDSAIIATKDAVFVSALHHSQKVKVVYDLMAKAGRSELNVSPLLRFNKGAHVQSVQKWIQEEAYPVWSRYGPDFDGGGFHEILNFDAEPVVANKRLRTMARQTYCFAIAAQRSWHADGEKLAEHGVRFLSEQAQQADGRFPKEYSFTGEVSDPAEDLYDMAFVLYAASHATNAKIAGAQELAQTAFNRLESHFLFEDGRLGYKNSPTDAGPVPRVNPLMHMVEALHAWHGVSGEPIAFHRINQIFELFHSRFYAADDWAIREVLDSSLNAFPDPLDNICEAGHHMEWAWLLNLHDQLTGDDSNLLIRRLYTTANSFGRNPITNLAYQSNTCQGDVVDDTSRGWAQSEAIRAAIALASHGVENFDNEVEWRVSLLFEAHLNNAPEGMWIDSFDSAGNTLSKSVPASIFYHHLGALIAYLDHAESQLPTATRI